MNELYSTLKDALGTYGDDLRIACAFTVEDMVVLHEVARAGHELGRTPRVFVIDDGHLAEPSFVAIDRIRARYDVTVDVYFPHDGDPKGTALARALEGARVWITGQRREPGRHVAFSELDERGLVKLNPLTAWTDAELWSFVRSNGVALAEPSITPGANARRSASHRARRGGASPSGSPRG
jgi:3'-phosphoadenosine 5'-phosphosulfate sulfotransferase (PAPS reductase)/FAD synthetase